MINQAVKTPEYRNWLIDIKQRIRQAQIKAAVQINSTLLTFYWELVRTLWNVRNQPNGAADF